MKTGSLWDCMPKVALHGYGWKTSNAPHGEWMGHSYQVGWKIKFFLLFLSPGKRPRHKEFMHMESRRKWAKAGLGGVVEKFHCQERMRLVSLVVTSSQLGSLSWEESMNLTYRKPHVCKFYREKVHRCTNHTITLDVVMVSIIEGVISEERWISWACLLHYAELG